MASSSHFMQAQHKAIQLWAAGCETSKNSFYRAQKLNVYEGDIVFLKHHASLNDHDHKCLIKTGYLYEQVTSHPVIVLNHERDSTHAIVTTVSAYGSGDWNNNLVPWNQPHQHKGPQLFRAFQGSEAPYKNQALLSLEGGKLMPKLRTSWVNVTSAFVVPITALQSFDKSDTRLRMTLASLEDLKSSMSRCLQIRRKDSRLSYTFVDGQIRYSSNTAPTSTPSATPSSPKRRTSGPTGPVKLSQNVDTASPSGTKSVPVPCRQTCGLSANPMSWAKVAGRSMRVVSMA